MDAFNNEREVEVLARKVCSRCQGRKGHTYECERGNEHWSYCLCTEKTNPAGAGYEVVWVKLRKEDGQCSAHS